MIPENIRHTMNKIVKITKSPNGAPSLKALIAMIAAVCAGEGSLVTMPF